ncbi:MAG: helix-turn-helix domain-containing protein [Tepidiformaceae bacterium]
MDWTDTIRTRRTELHLTQAELAQTLGLSAESVASWECARRRPSPAAFQHLAQVLKLDAAALAQFQRSSGREPTTQQKYSTLARLSRPLATLSAEIATYPWPCLVTNERFEIVAWNRAANAIAELDFATDLAGPGERQLLRMAASGHFRRKLISWDPVITHLAGHYKKSQIGLAPGAADPFFADLVQFIFTNYPDLAQHLMELWANAEPFHDAARNEVDILWRTSVGVDLHFSGPFTSFNDFDAAWAFDWHPADAATWDWLEANRDSAPEGGDCFDSGGTPTSWRSSLRQARAAAALTRIEAAERTHGAVSASAIDAYERGLRFPSREKLLSLTAALHLDGVHTNAILLSAGMAPEPSNFARFLLGEPPRFGVAYPGGVDPWDPDEVRADLDSADYPALCVDRNCRIVGANATMCGLLAIEPSTILDGAVGANLLYVLASEPPRSWLQNWEQVIRAMAPFQLERYYDDTEKRPADNSASEAINRIEPRARTALLRALTGAGQPDTVRAITHVQWQHDPASPTLDFECVLAPYYPGDPLWTIAWHPSNAATWRALPTATP